MYYQNYEDYMRSILGYPLQEQRMYENTYADYSNINDELDLQMPRYSSEIMNLYPEIYKIVNPMVCKLCQANTKPICRELIEQMTDEIYLNLESDPSQYAGDVVNVQVNLPDSREDSKTRIRTDSRVNSKANLRTDMGTKQEEKIKSQSKNLGFNNSLNNRSAKDSSQELALASANTIGTGEKASSRVAENRQFGRRNNILRDLIKILILNQLLGGGNRPPRPPHHPRPPFPGGPGHNPRPPRPPFPGGPGMSPSTPSFPGGPSFPTPSLPSFPIQ